MALWLKGATDTHLKFCSLVILLRVLTAPSLAPSQHLILAIPFPTQPHHEDRDGGDGDHNHDNDANNDDSDDDDVDNHDDDMMKITAIITEVRIDC